MPVSIEAEKSGTFRIEREKREKSGTFRIEKSGTFRIEKQDGGIVDASDPIMGAWLTQIVDVNRADSDESGSSNAGDP
jgi:hypothetical protein